MRGTLATISKFLNPSNCKLQYQSLKMMPLLHHITRYMVLDTSLRMERSREYEERIEFWETIVDRLPN